MALYCYLNKYMEIKRTIKKNSRIKTKGGVGKIQAQTLRLSEETWVEGGWIGAPGHIQTSS